jgi:hypothetical protein
MDDLTKDLIMNEKIAQIIRWTSRVLAALLAALILLIFIGEAVADEMGSLNVLTLREQLMMAAFFIAFLGLILGWLREKLGGWLVVGGMAAFYLLDLVFSGTFPQGATFLLIAIPGLLYLLSGYSNSESKTFG